ncbi:unnamed protein product, partial [Scytosiphon promiscuus]
RIQVSRDEQAKTLQRIRKADAHRRERLERSIKAKDKLVERIRAKRVRSSKAVVFRRSRWTREKKAMLQMTGSWVGETGRRATSRCIITALNAEVGGSLSSSVTQPTLPSTSTLTSEVRSHLIQRSDESDQDLRSPSFRSEGMPIPWGASGKSTSHHPGCQHRQPKSDEEERSAVHDGDNNVDRLTFHTAPASLRCDRIIDAETGELLELRRRRWKFPLMSTRARTVGSISFGGIHPGYTTDRQINGVHSVTVPEQVDQWRVVWHEGKGVNEGNWGNNPHPKNCAARVEWVQDGGKTCCQTWKDNECKRRRHECGEGCSCGCKRDGNDACVSQCGVRSRRGGWTEAESNRSPGCGTRIGDDQANTSGTQAASASCSDSTMSLEGNVTIPATPIPLPRGRHKKGPCNRNGRASPARRAKDVNSGVTLPVLDTHHQKGREEPPTPRVTARPVSPFWITCPQEPPWFSHRSAAHTADRSPHSTNTSRDSEGCDRDDAFGNASSGGRETGNAFEVKTDANAEGSSTQARNISGGRSADSGKRDPSAASSLTMDTSPDGRVRKNMVEAQKIRDRYLSQLQHMIMAENAEEDRRAVALRFAAGHPLRIKRLQLRHEKERAEKRALIRWIRRDIELIVVQKMAALGLIR